METKKSLGVILIALGFLGLVPGVLGVFEGQQFFGISPWAFLVLGLLFFVSGISLLKNIGSAKTHHPPRT